MNEAMNSHCSRCGAEFRCGVTAGEGSCWCMGLPVLPESSRTMGSCYCPVCLKDVLANGVRQPQSG